MNIDKTQYSSLKSKSRLGDGLLSQRASCFHFPRINYVTDLVSVHLQEFFMSVSTSTQEAPERRDEPSCHSVTAAL